MREVWMLDRTRRIQVHALRAGDYQLIDASELLPTLELGWLCGFLSHESQSQAVRALRDAMRSSP